ncbi:hypothetical protein [Pontibacter pamirensis]|uniref:hypothetical protein n=1 Tax=Pontibacter pamirensis TaxID=2562824 RepID=UPI0013898404|nr:hypothetical protein [Pontibacter pamirensis]
MHPVSAGGGQEVGLLTQAPRTKEEGEKEKNILLLGYCGKGNISYLCNPLQKEGEEKRDRKINSLFFHCESGKGSYLCIRFRKQGDRPCGTTLKTPAS